MLTGIYEAAVEIKTSSDMLEMEKQLRGTQTNTEGFVKKNYHIWKKPLLLGCRSATPKGELQLAFGEESAINTTVLPQKQSKLDPTVHPGLVTIWTEILAHYL